MPRLPDINSGDMRKQGFVMSPTEAPNLSGSWPQWPVELGISTKPRFGLAAGCGVGLFWNLVYPASQVPGVGRLISDMGTRLERGLGPARVPALKIVSRAGFQEVGAGCGVGLMYGAGAGVFVKPSTWKQLLRHVDGLKGQLKALLPGLGGESIPLTARIGPRQPDSSFLARDGLASSPEHLQGPLPSQIHNDRQTGQSYESLKQEVEMLRVVSSQQQQIIELQRDIATLKQAVCKIDRKAPFCKLPVT